MRRPSRFASLTALTACLGLAVLAERPAAAEPTTDLTYPRMLEEGAGLSGATDAGPEHRPGEAGRRHEATAGRHEHGAGGHGTMGGGMMGGGDGRPWLTIMLHHRREIGLSAEQVGKLYDLRASFEGVARERMRDIEEAEATLATTVAGADVVDLSDAERQLRRIEALRADLRLARLKTLEEGKRLLTDDQRAKLRALDASMPAAARGPGMRARTP